VTTTGRPSALAASSNGSRVSFGTREGKLFELSVSAPGQVRQVADYGSNQVRSLTYSPDGQILVAGLLDGSLRVLSGDSRRNLAILRGPGSRVTDLAYSPDGRFLAAASNDGNVYLWHTSDWEASPLVFPENNGFVLAVCFNRNSSYFYSGSVDYPRLVGRPTEASQMGSDFCSLVGRNLTIAEWDQFFDGDLPYEETCPGLNQ
jgi:WD40 repeat protein